MKLIIGMGQTGFSAGRFFRRRGDAFVAADTRGADAPREAWSRAFGAGTVFGGPLAPAMFDDPALRGLTGVVLSPGLDPAAEPLRDVLAEAARRGVRVESDIALALRHSPVPYLLITGSNGKSTVTALTADLLTALGYRVGIGGNYGTPALDLLVQPLDVLVLEVSSFQLEACRADGIHARAASVLNISPDHLDRHGTLDAYAALKQKLLVNAGTAVINLDDPIVSEMASICEGRLIGFSAHSDETADLPTEHRYYLDVDGEALCRDDQVIAEGLSLALPGAHNRVNVLATLALVESFAGRDALEDPRLQRSLAVFAGLPHRMQVICSRWVDGVVIRFINDSKATNVGAAVAAVEGLAAGGVAHQVVIVGGQTKGQSFEMLAESLIEHADAVVLIGEGAADIEAALDAASGGPRAGGPAIRRADSMAEAVDWAAGRAQELARGFARGLARRPAQSGRAIAVLLSPACASYDMFRGYADRGESFARASEASCAATLAGESLSEEVS
ncbi:MAG: UDP-N-acetylmuramoyl-L-alanine--D-glutamate ligase [Halothiobacillaceae bacterium]|nr:UDP-N-acetylmuramoyl-L-alanine--D-glutamate ligase [Halothiobacillaceae bacterium]HER34932.1 UDP-N-acetylmuramoyl-L-alanine--D-glutamate ligase [Halothiobacillaceae bacterium]